jgi:hypothetical protein
MRPQRIRLGLLFAIGSGEVIGWDEAQLSRILRRQLKTSLLSELRPLASQIHALGIDISPGRRPIETFDDLLKHPCPNVALLVLAKDFAKTVDCRLEDPLPTEVGSVLYLLLIAAALVRCSTKITKMDNNELREGFEWLQGCVWVDAPMRQLAADALGLIPAF